MIDGICCCFVSKTGSIYYLKRIHLKNVTSVTVTSVTLRMWHSVTYVTSKFTIKIFLFYSSIIRANSDLSTTQMIFPLCCCWYVLLGLSGRRGIAVACVCPSVCPSVRKLCLVCTITRHRFGIESPNLHQTCISGYSRRVMKMKVINLDLQGRFGHFALKF